jgi:hypothetical protein
LDRTAVVIITLGVFLGSVYSIASQTRDLRISPLPEAKNDQSMLRSSSILDAPDGYTTATPPSPKAPSQDDSNLVFDYVTEAATGEGRGAEDAGKDTLSGNADAGEVVQITTDADGVTATYPEVERRYFYEDFVAAVIVLSGNSTSRDIAVEIGAIIVDEFSTGRVLVFLPGGSESALDSLVNEGSITSYELGGWGTGLGKA